MTSVLLIAPQGLKLRGRSGDIRVAELSDWHSCSELGDIFSQNSDGTVVIGRAAEVDVDSLRTVLHDAPRACVVPLRGYEWVSSVQIPGAVMALVPGLGSGVLAVVPRDQIRQIADSATTADDLIRSVIRRGGPMADLSIGRPTASFTPPRLCPLEPATSVSSGEARVFDVGSVAPVVSRPDAVAVKAGLLLMYDQLDESHALSQSIEGQGRRRAGDYWHAILHRREPDYGNARYWFRHVARHPLFDELSGIADSILHPASDPDARPWAARLGTPLSWNPSVFVDLCESAARREDSPLGIAARQIQWYEMLLLLRWTFADAIGAELPESPR
jgi:hypothetical protein